MNLHICMLCSSQHIVPTLPQHFLDDAFNEPSEELDGEEKREEIKRQIIALEN